MRIAHVMGGSLEPGARGGVCDVCGTERPCVRLVEAGRSNAGCDTFICHVCSQKAMAEYLGSKAWGPCEYCDEDGRDACGECGGAFCDGCGWCHACQWGDAGDCTMRGE